MSAVAQGLTTFTSAHLAARVKAVDYEVIWRADDALVICPSNGSWAVLSKPAVGILQHLRGEPLSVLQEQVSLDPAAIWECVQQLFDYGIVSVDGATKYPSERQTDFPLTLLVLKLTNACNLWCKYCYNEGLDPAAGGIPLETAFAAIDSALDTCEQGLTLVLHGGEPFLQFRRIKKIVEYAERKADTLSKELHFSLQTNATILTEEIVDFVKNHRIGLGVSFDGINTANDEVRVWRNGKGSSSQILNGIRLLQQHGLPVNIITVVTKHNADRLYDVVLNLQEMGCRTVKFSYFFPQGRGELFKDLAPDPESIVRSLKRIVQGINLGEVTTIEVEDLVSQIDNIIFHDKNSMCHRSPCGAGKDMMTVFPSGKIYACDCLVHPDFYLGDIETTSLADAARHPKLIPLHTRQVEYVLPCTTCPVQRICGGTMTCRAFWNNGVLNSIDSSECFVNQNMIEHLIWSLMESPTLLEYYRRFKQATLVKPVNYA